MKAVNNMDPYAALGVSSSKVEVHKAIENLPKGLFPGAFCKIMPSPFNKNITQILHSDGAGTKSNLAYLAKKLFIPNYLRFFESVAQDSAVMNIDDIASFGVCDNIYLTNHIERNANRISGEDIAAVISGYLKFIDNMKVLGINIIESGGETADVGSYISTMGLSSVTLGYVRKEDVIDCSSIKPGNIIIGFSSAGQSSYEVVENSGMRSNGYTFAINTLIHKDYRIFSEICDSTLPLNMVFRGPYHFEDKLEGSSLSVGESLLSATRAYLPVLRHIFNSTFAKSVKGIIHCSGGGLTKSINFGKGLSYNINTVPSIPPIFRAIQNSENIDPNYMFSTFNMGVGMEVIVDDPDTVNLIIGFANYYNIDAFEIGTVLKSHDSNTNEVKIYFKGDLLTYTKNI